METFKLEKNTTTNNSLVLTPNRKDTPISVKNGDIASIASYLKQHPEITTLILSDNTALTDIAALQDVTTLKVIDFAGCTALNDISALSHLKSLEYLNLAATSVENIQPLLELPYLTTVYTSNTQLSESNKVTLNNRLSENTTAQQSAIAITKRTFTDFAKRITLPYLSI